MVSVGDGGSVFWGVREEGNGSLVTVMHYLKNWGMRLTRPFLRRFVSPCTWRKSCMKQGRCRWIDCPSKEHETFCEYICCKPKNNVKKEERKERTFSCHKPENSMTIYSGMFKVYSCRAISTNYNLKLPE